MGTRPRKACLSTVSWELEARTVLMAAGRSQGSKHVPSLNRLAYTENCIEQITTWNTVGGEESLEQNKGGREELGERHLLLLIFMDSAIKPLFSQRAGPCSLAWLLKTS